MSKQRNKTVIAIRYLITQDINQFNQELLNKVSFDLQHFLCYNKNEITKGICTAMRLRKPIEKTLSLHCGADGQVS